jgi:hypothetical protein
MCVFFQREDYFFFTWLTICGNLNFSSKNPGLELSPKSQIALKSDDRIASNRKWQVQ